MRRSTEQLSTFGQVKSKADRFIHHTWVEISILVLIVISVGLMLIEVALPKGSPFATPVMVAGNVITGLFVVELAIRFWVARKKKRFFLRYWLDILAVLPLVRPLRFFRVLRVLRLFRAGVLINRRMSFFQTLVRGTSQELTALVAGTLVLVLAAAVVLHLWAAQHNSSFSSFNDVLWYAVLSMIGGEPIGATPTSEVGRWVTLVLMIGGLTVFGMFVGTVSAGMVSKLSSPMEVQEMGIDELSGHVLLCGWNRSGPTVIRELFGPGTPKRRAVVLVTEHKDPPSDLYSTRGIRPEFLYHFCGDWTRVDVLNSVNANEAAVAILLTDNLTQRSSQDRDARTVLAALTIERMNPDIYTV
ncbi:MAG: potassium channel protein, partial [Proteobacteria bacterium]|nr:potassium channel protein [Pseudomonadota bacterium]